MSFRCKPSTINHKWCICKVKSVLCFPLPILAQCKWGVIVCNHAVFPTLLLVQVKLIHLLAPYNRCLIQFTCVTCPQGRKPTHCPDSRRNPSLSLSLALHLLFLSSYSLVKECPLFVTWARHWLTSDTQHRVRHRHIERQAHTHAKNSLRTTCM